MNMIENNYNIIVKNHKEKIVLLSETLYDDKQTVHVLYGL